MRRAGRWQVRVYKLATDTNRLRYYRDLTVHRYSVFGSWLDGVFSLNVWFILGLCGKVARRAAYQHSELLVVGNRFGNQVTKGRVTSSGRVAERLVLIAWGPSS